MLWLDVVVRDLVKIKNGDLVFRFISLFAAAIAIESINVLRKPAGDGKVSLFKCFSLVRCPT